MLVTAFDDLIWCTTQTTGTGDYVIDATARAGFGHISTLGHGKVVAYVCRDTVNRETGYGTIAVGGQVTLQRTQIVKSTNGNAAVNWTSGTRDIYIVALAQDMALRNRTNVFEADQDLNGNALILSPDGATSLEASDTTVTLTCASGLVVAIDAATGTRKITLNDNGAGAGPVDVLERASASPADNDLIAAALSRGRNDAAEPIDYVTAQTKIISKTDGAEGGEWKLSVKDGGSDVVVVQANPSGLFLHPAGTNNVAVGKAAVDATSAGVELRSSGTIYAIRSAAPPLVVDRLGDDGTVITVRQDNTTEAQVVIAGNTVTWGPFTGAHSSWAAVLRDCPLGSVICTVDANYDAPDRVRERLPAIRLSQRRAETTVYGVYHAEYIQEFDAPAAEVERTLQLRPWLREQIVSIEPAMLDDKPVKGRVVVRYRQMQVAAIGTAPVGILCRGPVAEGDLLMTSDEPGVAERIPLVRVAVSGWAEGEPDGGPPPAETVWPLHGPAAVLGKASGTLGAGEKGLVRAVIWAG